MSKPIRISHSSAALYLECSQKYKYRYIDKIVPVSKNASLYFGSAIDLAVQAYLEDQKADWKEVFDKNWKRSSFKGETTHLYDSTEINYSYKDFDKDLLTFEDVKIAEDSQKELLPDFSGSYLEAMEHVTNRKKQRAYINFPDNELRYFNRLSWASMYRKGLIMLQAFMDDIAPLIEEVLMVQKRVQLKSDQGDILTGYVDMVLKLKEHGTVILDLKTASMEYDVLQTMISQQLGIYCGILGPELNSKKVGFAVLLKNINKNRTKTCKSCGHIGEGSHKKCDAEINGKRCNGEWDVKLNLKGRTQLLVEELSDTNIEAILNTFGGVAHAIKEEIYIRNPNACLNYNGCDYFSLCWKGQMAEFKKEE